MIDYEVIFNKTVKHLTNYIVNHKLCAMVLGISGGIDSTVCAAICHEVSKKTGVPLIGRSLTIKNKTDEVSTASVVGKAFCNDFSECNLMDMFQNVSNDIMFFEKGTINKDWTNPIADGNIQARLRMVYLYHLAGVNKGIVIDTLNKTEHLLGFWTINGDVGDYAPIFELMKTEVYGLAHYLMDKYKNNPDMKYIAIEKSIGLTPTDGLGISSSDVEQLGAKDYNEVDDVFKRYFGFIINENNQHKYNTYEGHIENFLNAVKDKSEGFEIDYDTANNILRRFEKSMFKRASWPIHPYVINQVEECEKE